MLHLMLCAAVNMFKFIVLAVILAVAAAWGPAMKAIARKTAVGVLAAGMAAAPAFAADLDNGAAVFAEVVTEPFTPVYGLRMMPLYVAATFFSILPVDSACTLPRFRPGRWW